MSFKPELDPWDPGFRDNSQYSSIAGAEPWGEKDSSLSERVEFPEEQPLKNTTVSQAQETNSEQSCDEAPLADENKPYPTADTFFRKMVKVFFTVFLLVFLCNVLDDIFALVRTFLQP